MRTIQQVLPFATGLTPDSAYHAAKILYESGQNETALKILKPKLDGKAAFPNRANAEALLKNLSSP